MQRLSQLEKGWVKEIFGFVKGGRGQRESVRATIATSAMWYWEHINVQVIVARCHRLPGQRSLFSFGMESFQQDQVPGLTVEPKGKKWVHQRRRVYALGECLNSDIGNSDQVENINHPFLLYYTLVGYTQHTLQNQHNYQHIQQKDQEMEGTGFDVPGEAPNKRHEPVQISGPNREDNNADEHYPETQDVLQPLQ